MRSIHLVTGSVVYSFGGAPLGDGAAPEAALTLAPSGVLYGTTASGGSEAGSQGGGGTLYDLTVGKKGATSYASLFAFPFNPSNSQFYDGAEPEGTLAIDKDGNIYGTAYLGGTYSSSYGYGAGVVFKYASSGLTVLHAFTGGRDGASPSAGLTLKDDTLYGTTEYGGNDGAACPTQAGCGTMFQSSTSGSHYKVLHRFLGLTVRTPVAVASRSSARRSTAAR